MYCSTASQLKDVLFLGLDHFFCEKDHSSLFLLRKDINTLIPSHSSGVLKIQCFVSCI